MSGTLRQAADFVLDTAGRRASIGVILGSGQGHVAASLRNARAIDYASIPGIPQPTAKGHSGRLVLGEWEGRDCVVAQGRVHLYEGHEWRAATSLVELMLAIGIRALIVTNAAGGLDPRLRAGHLMLICDHIDFMFRRTTALGETRHRGTSFYDIAWQDRVRDEVEPRGVRLRQGVYVGVLGPNYETRAEYRMFRRLGGDAVGMSTIPEVLAAAQAGIPVLGISVITNEAKPDAPHVVSHADVIDWASRAEDDLRQAIEAALRQQDRKTRG